VPKLKKAEKHDIDVVIDRIKVPAAGDAAAAAPLRQRLAESFEAALRIADGRALAVEMDVGPSTSTRASSPARSATTRCPSSSRACSRSTRRSAPARPATASASRRCSTPSASSPSRR
jgi:excinuclease UvrABC ATPase subunit